MSDQKYVPANVFLRCDKGVIPCQLTITRPGPDLYDEKWAVEGDALPVVNIGTFGACAASQGAPCVPATTRWQRTLLGALQVDAGGRPQNPLLDNSILPCLRGGKIDIFFTRAAVTQALQATADAKQIAAAKQLSSRAKTASFLLLGAAILVAAVVIVATGGAAAPLLAVAIEAGMAGAAVGAAVGTVAGGIEGYAHGGVKGAVEGAAIGFVAGGVLGGLGAGAAAVGGGAGLFLAASGGTFAIASAADAFTLYKQPTLENGLVLLGDLVVLFGGRLIEGQARGARELETPPGAEKSKCTKAGDPVDVASGAMFFDAVDVELPGPIPFRWERTWYSTSVRQGPLGHGWHHAYDQALFLDPEAATIALRLDDGRLAVFEVPDANNEYCAYYRPRQLELRPRPAGAAGYVVRHVVQGLDYHFTPSPHRGGYYQLVSIANPHGHALTFTYSDQGHLAAMCDSAGRPIGVRTDEAGRILALDLPHADGSPGTFAAVQYAYDEAGNMLISTNAEGHAMHLAYDAQHRIVRKTFATGMSFYFTYDEQNRCIRTWGDEGYYDCYFTYTLGQTTIYTQAPAATHEYLHEQGLVTTYVNPLGHTQHWAYNTYAELEAEQNALGHTTSYEYDARGNCTSCTAPDGATTRTSYNMQGRPLTQTDAAGHTWQWTYSEAGELTGRIDPTGAVTRYVYDAKGQLTTLTDALSHATHLRYDAQYNLAHVVAPDETIRSRAYDALGRLVQLTDARGQKQQRHYDRLGQLVAVREPDGRQIRLAYDGYGNLARMEDGQQKVEFTYTAVNRLAQRRQAGQQVRFSYDRLGRLISVRNEAGLAYEFTLDAAGRVAVEQGFDGLTRHYARDAAGRVTHVERPGGRTNTYQYDKVGRVAQVVYEGGDSLDYFYHLDGTLLTARSKATEIHFERDALGRVVQETQAGHTVRSTYDARGQRTTLTSTLGAAVSFERDVLGQVRRTRAGDWLSVVARDAEGLELHRQLSGGVQVGWQHDGQGRPVSQYLRATGGTVRHRRYQWQGADQLTAIEDTLLGTTHFTYDALGTLTATTYADGQQELRQPDAVGNLFRTLECTDRRYGKAGQLREANGTRYAYDAEGNLLSKTLPGGQQWHYAWDGAGQLIRVKRPDGYAVTMTYDALGRRVSKRFRGKVTRWVWDGNVPLHEWHELEVGPGAGNVAELTTWLFEEDRCVPAAKLTASGAQSVVCDHLGTPLGLYDEQGHQTWQAQLDSYGAVRQGKGKAQDCPFRYQGQYEDVETGLYYNRFRYYDPEAGQYISQDPIKLRGGAKLYSYVDNPNSQLDAYGLFPGPGFFSDLKWSGMGHHTVPRAHANAHGLDNLGTKRNSPTWYPKDTEVAGSAQTHHDAHLALERNGVPFNPGAPNANNPTSQTELLTRSRTAYQDPALGQKGVLRIPSTGEVVADNVTIAEAMEKALEWSANQPCP